MGGSYHVFVSPSSKTHSQWRDIQVSVPDVLSALDVQESLDGQVSRSKARNVPPASNTIPGSRTPNRAAVAPITAPAMAHA